MSKRKKCIPIVVFLLFIAVGICSAEPNKTVQRLMNEPVSLFDYGIDRLEKDIIEWVEDERINNKPPKAWQVYYDWHRNKIFIKLDYRYDYSKYKDIASGAKIEIESVIRGIRLYLSSSLESFFTHSAYREKFNPDDIGLGVKLRDITEIQLFLSQPRTRFYKGFLKCIAPLSGEDIYYSETKQESEKKK